MKYRIDYITTTPDGWSEQHTIIHERTLTFRGLKLVLKGLGKEIHSKNLERISGQWKLEKR